MKVFLLSLMLTIGITAFSQDAESYMGNTVFTLCYKDGSKMTIKGQSFYLVFHNNKVVNLLCGADLKTAVNNGVNSGLSKNGKWYASGSTVYWTWTDGNTGSATYSFSSTNLLNDDGDLFATNLGNF